MTEKILSAHLVEGELIRGTEIGIRIDQTLTQDATGTMAYLEFEAMGVPRVRTERSVAYIDHNTLQNGFENADDHRFIGSCAKKHGLFFSRPGNGICHQVHLERFGIPGKTLIGSDSHTPTGGGLGMLAIGAGGLDVAVAMGGGAYYITCPKVVNVKLSGKLSPWVAAKDVILEVLRRMTVKGGVGKVIEYTGEGVKTLTVPERATITNMGAELGATTSVFPSDETTRAYLAAQGREDVWKPLAADPGCVYDEMLDVDLSELEPLVALPHSPDNVVPVREAGPVKVDQVAIGSCTNSSFADLMKVAAILKGRSVAKDVSLVIAPGSSAILAKLAENGALADLIRAGARVIECACGPCIGMGQSPCSGGVSLRTFNRNFRGRSGTPDAGIYLVSPETAAYSALSGVLSTGFGGAGDADGIALSSLPAAEPLRKNDAFFLYDAAADKTNTPLVMGPNIKPFPLNKPLPDTLFLRVTMKAGDNITTDDIMPAGTKVLPYRSNVPYMSNFCFETIDTGFPERCRTVTEENSGYDGCAIVGGQNYGQGSSREHAALAPLHLGVRVVLARSFARIHRSNLINSGILPLVFEDPADYDRLALFNELYFEDLPGQLRSGGPITVRNLADQSSFRVLGGFSEQEIDLLFAGGKINLLKGGSR
jgi:aconitate hydratase